MSCQEAAMESANEYADENSALAFCCVAHGCRRCPVCEPWAPRYGADPSAYKPQRGNGPLHQELVGRLVSSGAKTTGFRKQVSAAFGCARSAEWPRIVPDAYSINGAARTVTVYEVIVTHPVTSNKLDAYTSLWRAMNDGGVRLALVLVRPYGEEERDLGARWHAMHADGLTL